ncbi:M28 family peptidase [Gemmiger sp.]
MQELTFETILRLPQMELKKALKAELKNRGYPVTDKPGYLYAEGTMPVLLVAHMDTVHRRPVEQICYSEDRAVAMSPQGIGGDDRCGVWMILQILRAAKCHVLFCEDEEIGCIGAKNFTRGNLQPRVNYIVELDRHGSNDAVFYSCDNPEFEDFITSFGFETADGSCSDISYIAPYLETAAVNISCGYYCEHQRYEYIRLEEMKLNANRVAQMVTQPTGHFEYCERQNCFSGREGYQFSMWDTLRERDSYKWLSSLPKDVKVKLGTAELTIPYAKIDQRGNIYRYIPELDAGVLTEHTIAVLPNGKKAIYNPKCAKCYKVIPLTRALEILNAI